MSLLFKQNFILRNRQDYGEITEGKALLHGGVHQNVKFTIL